MFKESLLKAKWKAQKYLLFEKTRADSKFYSTNCFHFYQCFFIHVPKTAGVSISTTLFGNLAGGHKTLSEYQKEFAPYYDQYFKFSFVRNPWDRIFSAYKFLMQGGFDERDVAWSENHLKDIPSFEAFIMEWLSKDKLDAKIHFIPQTYFLKDLDGHVSLDFIGKYETLPKDFVVIQKALGINKKLLHLNQSNSKVGAYKKQYSKEMQSKVAQLYRSDLINFDYQAF